ncbi:MAG: DUF4837 family protein [Bacteroidales bacterium]|nr:DUF4837 family protein [Bacteroidales bacterium]
MQKYLILTSFLTLFFYSCNFYENSNPVKPNATGKAGEIIVVIQDNLWEGHVGDTIYYALAKPFDVLPQDEATFDVVQIPHDAFQNIFKSHRNIIFINVSSQHPEKKLTLTIDKWANSQLVYHFYAPNDTAFIDLWEKNIDGVLKNIFKEEMKRYQRAYSSFQNDVAKRNVEEKYNIYLAIPNEYHVDVLDDHFCWISRETDISSQGILIYDYPYVDSNTFTLDYLVKKRNQITKSKVPGPNNGTYMQTETRAPIVTEQMTLNGNYAFMMRGLWYTENYFMGGPFVSFSVLDEKRNRVVTVEAYVYAGKQNKKLYVWQVESVLRSLKILE